MNRRHPSTRRFYSGVTFSQSAPSPILTTPRGARRRRTRTKLASTRENLVFHNICAFASSSDRPLPRAATSKLGVTVFLALYGQGLYVFRNSNLSLLSDKPFQTLFLSEMSIRYASLRWRCYLHKNRMMCKELCKLARACTRWCRGDKSTRTALEPARTLCAKSITVLLLVLIKRREPTSVQMFLVPCPEQDASLHHTPARFHRGFPDVVKLPFSRRKARLHPLWLRIDLYQEIVCSARRSITTLFAHNNRLILVHGNRKM